MKMNRQTAAGRISARFTGKLNTRWHERALQVFMFTGLAHWGEHLVQAYQIYVMGWPRPQANGILGLWYPWLIKSETLHYGYALVMLGFAVGVTSMFPRTGVETAVRPSLHREHANQHDKRCSHSDYTQSIAY